MADRLDPEARSRLMARIRGKNTAPELAVRRALHAAGFRFRLHRRDLPGTPDIVLPRYQIAIFVHGCFWHGHECAKGSLPKSREDYWETKIYANRERDKRKRLELEAAGWRIVTIWECEIRNSTDIMNRIARYLQDEGLSRPRS